MFLQKTYNAAFYRNELGARVQSNVPIINGTWRLSKIMCSSTNFFLRNCAPRRVCVSVSFEVEENSEKLLRTLSISLSGLTLFLNMIFEGSSMKLLRSAVEQPNQEKQLPYRIPRSTYYKPQQMLEFSSETFHETSHSHLRHSHLRPLTSLVDPILFFIFRY